MATIPKITGKKDSSVVNLQVAQVLADLNQLQYATDQRAALSLLQIKDTLDLRQSISQQRLPTPSNVFSATPPRSRRPTPSLQRLSTGTISQIRSGSDSTVKMRPGLRERTSTSGESNSSSAVRSRKSSYANNSTMKENVSFNIVSPPSDPDLQRAQTLLTLHSNRSSLLAQSTTKPAMHIPTNPSIEFAPYPFTLSTHRQAIDSILEQYTDFKEEEMAKDPEGMKRALEEVGLN